MFSMMLEEWEVYAFTLRLNQRTRPNQIMGKLEQLSHSQSPFH
ncbi:hypothetical protein JCM19233_5864 [Vibrio astriarenae]|nr:hypothetical protein JCM19233_5864 [Vibrio sp. C7]